MIPASVLQRLEGVERSLGWLEDMNRQLVQLNETLSWMAEDMKKLREMAEKVQDAET